MSKHCLHYRFAVTLSPQFGVGNDVFEETVASSAAKCLNLNRISCIYASRLWYSVQANRLTSSRTEAM